MQFDPLEFASFRQTQAALIRSEKVLDRGFSDLPIFSRHSDPIGYLQQHLEVSWSEGDELVEVSLTSKAIPPNELFKILDRVLRYYIAVQSEEEIVWARELIQYHNHEGKRKYIYTSF